MTPARSVRLLFESRFRGFRIVEVLSGLILAALVLGVYAFKAGAGREGAQIAETTRQIQAEQRRIRILRAELSHLESPDRLETLSTRYLGLQPVAPRREAEPDTVGDLVRAADRPPP